ncbi:chitin-binding domain protein cbd-1 [Drosophila eugracilis]|uniref:chitin-binding domain protein cbd-1 n=1 Tax=Drosophila eugracilis TaxID=29029 RepID=UPI0007E62A56|nr:chitin-binding domain protein cbd-1 [Drosophila eugracilis]
MKVCGIFPLIFWILKTNICDSYVMETHSTWSVVDRRQILSVSESNSQECSTSPDTDSSFCQSLSNGFYKYPYDCSAYISCNDSCADLEYCPGGKVFNSPLFICDTPEAVICEPLPYPTPPSTEIPSENPCNAKENNTFLPSSEDCNKFFLCVNHQSEVYQCPGEMLFNPDLNICDYKDNVLCYGDRTTQDPLKSTAASEDYFTKCEGQKLGTSFPDTQNCQQYYYCWGNGSYVILPCPVDNWFNPISGNCGPNISPEACREVVPTSTTLITTTVLTTVGPKSTENVEDNICADQELGTTFPLKSDCQSYLLCLNGGQSVTAKCPTNAWFDPQTGDCGPNVSPTACLESLVTSTSIPTTQTSNDPCADQELGVSYPLVTNCQQYILCMGNGESEVANCIYNAWYDPQTGICGPDVAPTACKEIAVSTESTTTLATSPLTTPSPTTLITSDPEETTTTSPDISGICSGQRDGYYATYPEDCSKYILCASPVPIAFYCPEGLFFNENLQKCVEWELSDCSNEEITTISPEHTTPSPDSSICFNNTDQNLPYQENCQWYIHCVDDSSYMMAICGSEEYFDPWTGECGLDVSPEACREIFTPTTSVTKTTEGSTTVIIPSTPSTQSPETDPCDGVPNGKLVSYPDDCTKFIQCVQPTPIVYDCREGQEFSASLERCMAPWYANCSIPATTTTATPPITTTIPPTADSFCTDKIEGSMVPYPSNCSKYIVCQDPIPVGYACPEGEEFSPSVLTCMEPYLANCNPNAWRFFPDHMLPSSSSEDSGFSFWQSFKTIASFVIDF